MDTIATCFQVMRYFPEFDTLLGGRSNESICGFANSSSLTSHMTAILWNRRLQVYNFLMNDLLFEIKMPSVTK